MLFFILCADGLKCVQCFAGDVLNIEQLANEPVRTPTFAMLSELSVGNVEGFNKQLGTHIKNRKARGKNNLLQHLFNTWTFFNDKAVRIFESEVGLYEIEGREFDGKLLIFETFDNLLIPKMVKNGMIIHLDYLQRMPNKTCVPEMFGNMTVQEIHYFIDNFEDEAWKGCKNKQQKIEVAIQVFGRGQQHSLLNEDGHDETETEKEASDNGSASGDDSASDHDGEPEAKDFTDDEVKELCKGIDCTYLEFARDGTFLGAKADKKELNNASSDTKILRIILVGQMENKEFIYYYKDGDTIGDLEKVLNKAVGHILQISFKFGESYLMSYDTISSVCDPLHNTIVAIPQLKGGAGKASTMKHILKKKCGVCPSDQETFQNLFATCALITSSQGCDMKKAMTAMSVKELVEMKKVLSPSRTKNDIKIAQMTTHLKEYKMLLSVKEKLEATIDTLKDVVAHAVFQDYVNEKGEIDIESLRDLATATIVEKETLAKTAQTVDANMT